MAEHGHIDQPQQAVRFNSVDEEIRSHGGLQNVEEVTAPDHAPVEEFSPDAQEELRILSVSLRQSRLQSKRMEKFAFEPVSLPVSRVSHPMLWIKCCAHEQHRFPRAHRVPGLRHVNTQIFSRRDRLHPSTICNHPRSHPPTQLGRAQAVPLSLLRRAKVFPTPRLSHHKHHLRMNHRLL